MTYTDTCVRGGHTYIRNNLQPRSSVGYINLQNWATEFIFLPDGKFYTPYDPDVCVHPSTVDHPPCCESQKGYSQGPLTAGNPINFGLGRKVQIESDYAAASDPRLSFERYYEVHVAGPYLPSRVGRDWNHSFNRALFDAGNPAAGVYSIGISEPNGHWIWFTRSGSRYVSMFSPADTLTRSTLGAVPSSGIATSRTTTWRPTIRKGGTRASRRLPVAP